MLDAFACYIPSRWFDDAGMSKGGGVQEDVRPNQKRRWKNSARSMPLSVAAAAAFAIASLMLAENATASNVMAIAAPGGVSPLKRSPGSGASVGQINDSFKDLFAAFRSGTKLITNDRTFQLAEKAAARLNDRPQGWSKKLASDVGDASD